MDHSKRYYSVNMFRVCIDSYREDISGRVYSPMSVDEISFVGISQLLLKMDKLFDDVGYPQAFQNKRSFEEKTQAGNAYRGIPKAVRPVESILDKEGQCYTCDVVVESRRNTSWQGRICEADGTELGKFNGEVELLEQLTGLTEA